MTLLGSRRERSRLIFNLALSVVVAIGRAFLCLLRTEVTGRVFRPCFGARRSVVLQSVCHYACAVRHLSCRHIWWRQRCDEKKENRST